MQAPDQASAAAQAGGTVPGGAGPGTRLPGQATVEGRGADDRGPTAGTGGTGAAAVARGPKPLPVGIVLTATTNAASFGVEFDNTYDEKEVDDALIAAMNAKGGLVGRKIVPIYAKTDTGSNNWETDFAAACATFTQDNKVEAVLGYVFNYSAAFERCLAKRGIPHLNTGFNIPDSQELRPFPLHVALDVPTIGRRGLLKLSGAAADGVLTAKNKIGVFMDSCPGTQRSYDQIFLPEVRRLRLTVEVSTQGVCGHGNSDSGRAVQELQSAVLQFAGRGVDRVIFHASAEGGALLLFSLSAESQGYRPEYIVSSLGNLETLKGFAPNAQLKNMHAYGWLPTQDIPPSAYPKPTPTQQRCLSLLRSRNVVPASGADYYYAYNICEAFFVYELALAKTQGSTDGRAVIDAVHGLGTSFSSATNDGGSAFSAAYPDAPRGTRHVLYRDACTCFAYTGPRRAIPSR
jgi:hypothetical protein